ncbi:TIGR02678 family protein [Solirubrobacter soli]|uniref:TIGR02678 family protein n=1 Tax=Solirubrobacter soli TaxID=363832 RepID=UPI000416CA71|nr:TIGR02678 family protein [Solirubrobacter soli]
MSDERLIEARRALLARPLLPAGDPAFGTVRAHAERLRSEFARELGYELVVRATHARLRKRSHAPVTDRPARIPRSGHPDTWQPFTRRHYVLFALALAACERARAQTTIGLLAEEVRSLAGEDGIEVDLDRLDDRRCLADVFLYLCGLGVLMPIAGHSEGWVRSRSEDDETLYDVMHSPLDDLIVAPRVIGARDVRGLLFGGVYPSSEEGVLMKRSHRVARRLVEDPVLYLSELSEAERASYLKVRGSRDHFLAAWLGLEAECRREGTALIDGEAEPLTDLRFPAARPWTRQVALLLAEALCGRVRGGQSRFEVSEIVGLCESLRDVWGDALCAEEPSEMAARGLEVLAGMRLVRVADGDVIPLPAIARLSHIDMTDAQQRLEDLL